LKETTGLRKKGIRNAKAYYIECKEKDQRKYKKCILTFYFWKRSYKSVFSWQYLKIDVTFDGGKPKYRDFDWKSRCSCYTKDMCEWCWAIVWCMLMKDMRTI